MYKDVLQHIAGVEIYPIISLVLFLFASLMVGLRVWKMSRKEVQDMSMLPLDDGPEVDSGKSEERSN